MPRPSKGCRTCRRRKIRCDQVRPTCLTCRKSGRQCLGYDIEASGFGFRIGQAIHSTWQTIPDPDEHSLESAFAACYMVPKQEQQTGSSLSMEHYLGITHIPMVFNDSLRDRALAYYWTYYLVDASSHPSDSIRSYTQLILSKPSGITEPILDYAIAAESLLIFGKKHGITKSIDLARESYYCALRETTSSVQNVERACSDQFLLAVMIFSGYEFKIDSARDPRSRPLEAEGFKHHVGAMSILKLRQEMQAHDKTHIDNKIDRMVRQQILRSCVMRAYPMPEILSDGASFGEADEALQLDRCFVEIARLRSLSQQLLLKVRSGSILEITAMREALGLLRLAIQIDMQLDIFTGYLEANWPYLKISYKDNGSNLRDNDLIFANVIHIYPTHTSSHLWNSCRSARMICNSVISSLSRRASLASHSDVLSVTTRARARLTDLIETVCESVSFYLLDGTTILNLVDNDSELITSLSTDNEVCRAYRLTFVLVVALMTDGLDDIRKCWIRDKIGRIGKITTSGTLLMLAN